jgi:hypothetical protein
MPRREAIVAGAVVASVGVLSLPVAAAFDSERAWWDYRGWDWFGNGKVVTFDWNHTYGPLNWSRAGETVLNVKSDRPQYWKAETLDGFDGFRWIRTNDRNDTLYGTQVAYSEPRIEGRWDYGEYNLDWDKHIRVNHPGRGRGARALDGRRHHPADRHRPAREGGHLLGPRLHAEPDPEADAGHAPGLPPEPDPLHGDHAPQSGRVRDRRAGGR